MDTMMNDRIAMFTPSAVGGHPLYTQELLTALTEHPRGGNRFELISSEDLDPQFRNVPYPINAVLPRLLDRRQFASSAAWIVNRTLHYPRRERAMLRWLSTRPDITAVHFQEFALWTAPGLIRRIQAMGKRVFYTLHNFRPHKYPPFLPHRLQHHWHRRASLQCDAILVHTDAMAREMAELFGDPHPPIRVCPHGVWTARNSTPIPPLAKRLGWKKLLFFGAIRRNKGVDLLLDAADSLSDFSITIAGDPSDQEYFNQQLLPAITRLQALGNRIELIPRFLSDDEAATLFAAHSAVVLPYRPEFRGQSGVAFLAIAHGMPVVAGNFGAVGELFHEHKIGRTFDAFTPASLTAAIRSLFDAPDLAALDGQIQAAKESLSWSTAAGITIDLYEEVRQARASASTAARRHGAPRSKSTVDDRVAEVEAGAPR